MSLVVSLHLLFAERMSFLDAIEAERHGCAMLELLFHRLSLQLLAEQKIRIFSQAITCILCLPCIENPAANL